MTWANPVNILRLNAAALAEAREAARVFEERRPGLGERFAGRLNDTLGLIAEHPGSYQRVNDHYRRAFMKHFPFVVVYRTNGNGVEVVGVLPTQADPTAMAVLTNPMVG